MSKLPPLERQPPLKTTEVELLDNGWLRVSAPLGALSLQGGFRHSWLESGKEAETLFKPHSYHEESDTSLVLCQPLTGRTHQIRVHLQMVGVPIANDTVYGGEREIEDGNPQWFWPQSQESEVTGESTDASTEEEKKKDEEQKSEEEEDEGDEDDNVDARRTKKPSRRINREDPPPPPPPTEELQSICTFCQHGEEVAFSEEQRNRSGIWLHALRYEVS